MGVGREMVPCLAPLVCLAWVGGLRPFRDCPQGAHPSHYRSGLCHPWCPDPASRLVSAWLVLRCEATPTRLLSSKRIRSATGTGVIWDWDMKPGHLWACRTPRLPAASTPRGTNRSAWRPRGHCSTAHSRRSRSRRSAGRPCLGTGRAYPERGLLGSVRASPGGGHTLSQQQRSAWKVALSCGRQSLSLAPPALWTDPKDKAWIRVTCLNSLASWGQRWLQLHLGGAWLVGSGLQGDHSSKQLMGS